MKNGTLSNVARDLSTAHLRFLAAEKVQVHSVTARWGEYEKFASLLRATYRAIKRSGTLERTRPVFQILWNVHDLLAVAPMSPSDGSLGLATAIAEIGPLTNDAAPAWQDLRAAADSLLSSQHPAADIEGLFVKNGLGGLLRADRLAVVVSSKSKPSLDKYLNLGDRDFDLIDIRESKSEMWDCLILVGTQAPLSEQFQSREDSLKELSWIYTAPAAPQVVVITWSGAVKFDINDYQTRSEIPLPHVAQAGPLSVSEWSDSRKRKTKKIRIERDAEIECSNFVIDPPTGEESQANREWVVSYAKLFPPPPRLLVPDDYGVEVETIGEPSKFPIGGILVVRKNQQTESNVERDLIRELAVSSLPSGAYKKLRDKSDDFKRQLRLAKEDLERSVQRLRDGGFLNPNYYLNVCSVEQYIGPRSQEIHRRLCVALSIPYDEDTYAAIAAVRVAHQAAGSEITQRITNYLRENRGWEEKCRTENTCTEKDDSFGQVTLARVLAVEKGRCNLKDIGVLRSAETESDDESDDEVFQ